MKYLKKNNITRILFVHYDEFFTKELKKAIKNLLPYEVEQLKKWLQFFTSEHPELKQCLSVVS